VLTLADLGYPVSFTFSQLLLKGNWVLWRGTIGVVRQETRELFPGSANFGKNISIILLSHD
jgi:hypothetical protein